MHEFQADTTAVWEQRGQLLEQMRGMASSLVDLADAAADREPVKPDLLEALEPKTEAETKPQASNRREADSTVPTVDADDATDGGAREAPKNVPGSGPSKQRIKTTRRPG